MRHAPLGILTAIVFCAVLATGCATTGGRPARPELTARIETGMASYYGRKFHGRRTASGERFDMTAMTAAHPSLPFGTRVRVTNLTNGRAVVLRINDRGPFKRGRIIDVSRAAAKELAMIGPGTAKVRVEVVEAVADVE